MKGVHEQVEAHYGRGEVFQAILDALRREGKDPERLAPDDLAPVDAFHIRGREATVELARRAGLSMGRRVLDVGCGLGGAARYLASEYGCRVTGIDLTQEYVDTADALAKRVGLDDRVAFRRESALDMPFDEDSFEVVWTEHVQMNIADKGAFYGEIARVLRPGGYLLFHDIFAGAANRFHFPVPWAEDESLNFLVTPEAVREMLMKLGFSIREWEDVSETSLEWFRATLAALEKSGPPPLGVHLLMGENAKDKFRNQIENLEQGSMVVVQAVAEKSVRQ